MPHEQLYLARRTIPATETDFSVPFPPSSFLLLVDGSSFLLLNDGVSKVGLAQH